MSEKAVELINNVIAFAKAEATTRDEFGRLETELEKSKQELLGYITTLETGNASMREKLETLIRIGSELCLSSANDMAKAKWINMATKPLNRPQSGGGQESEK
jgi:hypothetical protein